MREAPGKNFVDVSLMMLDFEDHVAFDQTGVRVLYGFHHAKGLPGFC